MAALNNKNILWAIIIFLAILNLSSLGALWFRQGHRPFQRTGDERQHEHFLARTLNLTPEQQAEFDSLRAKHQRRMMQLTDEMNQNRELLLSKLGSTDNQQAVDSLATVIGEKQKEIELLNFNHFQQVMKHFNDDQKKQFAQMIRNLVFRPSLHEREMRRDHDSQRFQQKR